MSEQKPANITTEDWGQTPATVRTLLTRSTTRIEQLEAQIQHDREEQQPAAPPLVGNQILPANDIPLSGHVLVVDDNEMNRDMLSRRLKRQGHTVETAVDGREALKMIQTKKFDLVLLDIMMPEMNGYEVLEHMRADVNLSYIPVIMISAVDEIESIVRCIELGAEDYLPKPFNRVLLKARIGASLEKKRLRDRQEAYTRQLNIENQRKSDELEQARRIQQSMLPLAPPRLPHLDIAAHQQTASEVGGDYYDFLPQPNGKLRLAIGDATGHGAGSGLMVSMTKASLLAATETDLAALANKINNILNRVDLGTQLNMALLLLELSELQNGSVTVQACGGGMPPVYVLRAGGQVEEVLISGLPLGIINQANYQVTEFQLYPGDVMLLMSDGLLEMFNETHQFLGFDRLVAALSQIEARSLSTTEILARIAAIGRDWANGHPLYDDVTLVVTQVKNKAQATAQSNAG